ncbi:Monoglyceride lipase [Acropora cervicornis]|uniref:Monoglyceride lipase n=1 Tax=Acropora cervicornis TaxID=6130 RepID=A0AAD9VEC6_ACRCE|nr:Monoglyceride lipase [Acropora cervicornis]
MSRKVLSEENSFKNADGQKIFTKYWKPIGEKARALIFIAHGFGEHCSRYETLGTALAEEGFLAFSHDHSKYLILPVKAILGHGRSEGERAQIQDFSYYVRDVFTHIDQVAAENTGIPIFMFGHSMGGPITILSIFKRPSFFAGAIFSAPAIKSDPNKASTLMIFLGRIAAYIAPSYQLLPPIDPSLLTRNPVEIETDECRTSNLRQFRVSSMKIAGHQYCDLSWFNALVNSFQQDAQKTFAWEAIANSDLNEQNTNENTSYDTYVTRFLRHSKTAEKYANDPLVWHEGMKAKWTAQILEVMGEIQKGVSNITIPYLLLHGDDDRVVLIDGSHFLHDNSPSTDKTFKVYKDGRHELLNETKETADQVLQEILDWLKRKLA